MLAQALVLDILWIIIGIAIGLAIFIASIFVVQYIYKDAVDKDLNAAMWVLISLVAPIIGWIIYFIVRNYKQKAPAT
jgi:uncharacterized membrane protein YGL010W